MVDVALAPVSLVVDDAVHLIQIGLPHGALSRGFRRTPANAQGDPVSGVAPWHVVNILAIAATAIKKKSHELKASERAAQWPATARAD